MIGLIGGLGVVAAPGDVAAQSGSVIVVAPGIDSIKDAVALANPGDTLRLAPGLHLISSTVLIDKDLVIEGGSAHRGDVHLVGIEMESFNFEPHVFPEILDQGHLIFARSPATSVTFRRFTIKGAPETFIPRELCEEEPPFGLGLNHTECFGDAIHTDGVAQVVVEDVEASLNAGNGFWINGAQSASFLRILGVNNGAFGIDVDSAAFLSVRFSTFIANQVSGIEASGHLPGLTRAEYTADVEMARVSAKGNGEIGVEVERFETATFTSLSCTDNLEDGFDADRVSVVQISNSEFLNNLDDGIELFPAGTGVPPEEQPEDFPGSMTEIFSNLSFAGNVGQDINRPPTEN